MNFSYLIVYENESNQIYCLYSLNHCISQAENCILYFFKRSSRQILDRAIHLPEVKPERQIQTSEELALVASSSGL